MKRVTPDGKKIAEIRSGIGKPQKTVASDAGITDRFLRYIEKDDRPIEESVLVEIARSIGVSPNEIKKRSYNDNQIQKDLFGFIKMKITAVDSGGDLFRMAQGANKFNYHLLVDPTSMTAPIMEEMLNIVDCAVKKNYWHFGDGYEKRKFPDIYRIARMNELIPMLNHHGISILANTYSRLKWEDGYDAQWSREHIIHVCICPLNQDEYLVDVEPDDVKPLSRIPEDKPTSSSKSLDLDDDIPF